MTTMTNKTEQLFFRVTEKQREQIERKAQKMGHDVSGYVRWVVLREIKRVE